MRSCARNWQAEKTSGSLRRREAGEDDFFASVSLSYVLGADSAGNPAFSDDRPPAGGQGGLGQPRRHTSVHLCRPGAQPGLAERRSQLPFLLLMLIHSFSKYFLSQELC